MAYFIWKNEDSRNMGIVVKKLPPHIKPSERIEKITIPSRSGYLIQSENAYDAEQIKIECGLKKDADLYEVANWLRGTDKLILSDDTTKFYDATIINSIPFDIVFKYWRDFIIVFDPQPFLKSVNKITEVITTASSEIEVLGTHETTPIITINGSGDYTITINNKTFNLDNVDNQIVIDSEMMNCTEDSGATNANNKMSGNFPILISGTNDIDVVGTFSSIVIEYYDRWF
jgi:phage-related protein